MNQQNTPEASTVSVNPNKEMFGLLKEYEQWEADILKEDKLWWPNTASDVLRGKLYDTMLELQKKRNEIFHSIAGVKWAGQATPVDGWIDDSISVMQLNIGDLKVNCFDEDSEMGISVKESDCQYLSVDDAKELANFILSHIKNETEANPPVDEE